MERANSSIFLRGQMTNCDGYSGLKNALINRVKVIKRDKTSRVRIQFANVLHYARDLINPVSLSSSHPASFSVLPFLCFQSLPHTRSLFHHVCLCSTLTLKEDTNNLPNDELMDWGYRMQGFLVGGTISKER